MKIPVLDSHTGDRRKTATCATAGPEAATREQKAPDEEGGRPALQARPLARVRLAPRCSNVDSRSVPRRGLSDRSENSHQIVLMF